MVLTSGHRVIEEHSTMDKQSMPVQIGYLLNAYPAPLDQSVNAEILALQRTGIAPFVFYLQQPLEGSQHYFDEATLGIRRLGRLSWKTFWLIVIGHSWEMIKHPSPYLKILFFTIWREEPGRLRDLIRALHLIVLQNVSCEAKTDSSREINGLDQWEAAGKSKISRGLVFIVVIGRK